MKNLLKITALILAATLAAVPALSDSLVLKNGRHVTGHYEGGSARVVKFRNADGALKDYDILQVQTLHFGDIKSASAAPTSSSLPRLAPATQRPSTTSTTAANTAWTIPTGSKVVIRMIDPVNSEKNKLGDMFAATLDEPVMLHGIEVVPRNADVRGRIATINEAGRIAGKAQLGLELTQITVNGIPYSMTTSEYEEAGKARGPETAKRAGAAAAAGAVIGAIAGGKKGAAVGAGVGAGGATAVQVLTKGEKLNIPSETKLEFMLKAPLVIAAK